jgi:hypothetical protein
MIGMAARRARTRVAGDAPTLVSVANQVSFDKLTENATAGQVKDWANRIVSVFAQLNTNEVSVDLCMNEPNATSAWLSSPTCHNRLTTSRRTPAGTRLGRGMIRKSSELFFGCCRRFQGF